MHQSMEEGAASEVHSQGQGSLERDHDSHNMIALVVVVVGLWLRQAALFQATCGCSMQPRSLHIQV